MNRLKIFIIGIVSITALLLVWIYAIPLPRAITNPSNSQSLQILDRHGALLYEARRADFGSQKHIELTDIPPSIIDALLATEDRNFFVHPGIDPWGISRAAWKNLQAGRVTEGGSTITQQLVRNLLQPQRRNMSYKAYEALLALKLERWKSKTDILTSYLNTAYFGHQAYGIGAAAKIYFDKQASELSVAEGVLLVGLLSSPVRLDPFSSMEAAQFRQKIVLQNMLNNKKIRDDEYEQYVIEKVQLAPDRVKIHAPHFIHYLLASLPEDLLHGSTVRTTLDLGLQQQSEAIIRKHLARLSDQNVTSAAVVVLDAHTGEILTMVGSANYFDTDRQGAYNVATAPRQPGSALKPFTYAVALMQGDTLATTVADYEARFFTQEGTPYIPRNYDFQYHGLVRYREALANSYNIPAVKVLERVGVPRLLRFLEAAGITSLRQPPDHYGLALTLGSGEVSLLELTKAYALFPRKGVTLHTTSLLDLPADPGTMILNERIAWLITSALSDNHARIQQFGENSPLHFDFPAAAKTGTTRNSRDNWTIGYTPDRVVGVWVGNADNTPMRDTSGVTGAGPIFHDVMLAATRNLPPKHFTKPEGMVHKEICKLSGKLPTEDCPERVFEYFIVGTEPEEYDTMHRTVTLDKRNHLLAGLHCPRDMTYEKRLVYFPPELLRWSLEQGYPLPPSQHSPYCPPEETDRDSLTINNSTHPPLLIIKPHDGDTFQLIPLIPLEHQKIIFEAAADAGIQTVDWFLDGEKMATVKPPHFRWEWIPHAGNFTISAQSTESTATVRISVE